MMFKQVIDRIWHKASKNMYFIFLPWLTFMSQGGAKIPDQSKLVVGIGNCKAPAKVFDVKIVNTERSRTLGLSGRTKPLHNDEGMLFVFQTAQRVGFWMKDTLIPLEIAYFDSKGEMTQLIEMPVEKNPARPQNSYPSKVPIVAALELAPHSLENFRNKNLVLCANTLPAEQH